MTEERHGEGSSFSLSLIGRRQGWAAAAVMGLAVVIYLPTFRWMLHRWGAADSYYSHGYLVLPVSLYLLWMRRQSLYERLCRRPAGDGAAGRSAGFVLILLAVGMHVLSGYFRVYFTSGFSLVLLLYGIAIYLFGLRVIRDTWFAIGFLVFMVPLPLLVIARLNLGLKLFATKWALGLLDLAGVLAVQDGSTIIFHGDTLTVGNACSGLRSIISLLALGAVYAYLFRGQSKRQGVQGRLRIKQVLLFFCSIPVAMIANVLRIFTVGLVASAYGSELAAGKVHDVSGYLLFAVAFGLLFLVGKLLDRLIQT